MIRRYIAWRNRHVTDPSSARSAAEPKPSRGRGLPDSGRPAPESPEAVGVPQIGIGAHPPAIAGGEDVRRLHDAALGASGKRTTSRSRRCPHGSVPTCATRSALKAPWGGERGPEVLSGQHRKGAHRHHSLAGTDGAQDPHARQLSYCKRQEPALADCGWRPARTLHRGDTHARSGAPAGSHDGIMRVEEDLPR